MGFRFRKSFKVGPFRTTVSKSGISTSFGIKGARITKTANGRTCITAGIPGTGINYVSKNGKGRTASATANNHQQETKPSMALGVFYRVLSVPLILLGLLLAFAVHPVYWVFVALGVIEWIYGGNKIKQAKQVKEENLMN